MFDACVKRFAALTAALLPSVLLAAECSPKISPDVIYADSTAQRVSITVGGTAPDCKWTVTNTGKWVAGVSPASGEGTTNVTVSLAENPSKVERTGALRFGGTTLKVIQRATQSVFEDVKPSDSFFDGANLLRQRSVTAGCSATPLKYCPHDEINRGQLAIFVTRIATGGDGFESGASPRFADVPASHPYFRWIQKLSELKIYVPCKTANGFCPEEVVTRGQMAAFLVQLRELGKDFTPPEKPVYSDVPRAHSLFRYIQMMKTLGIPGCSATAFCPEKAVTRGQMAEFLLRGLPEPGAPRPAQR